jgi:hypothetical protein
MATELPKRIYLIGDGRMEEALAAEVIKPGHLVKLNSDGDVIKHNSAGGWAEKSFAQEDALQGKTIDDAYAVNDSANTPDIVFIVMAQTGDVVYAWLAAGESADPSKFLASNGDGTLQVAGSSDIRLAVPLETVDNSDTGENTAVRIRVRIL